MSGVIPLKVADGRQHSALCAVLRQPVQLLKASTSHCSAVQLHHSEVRSD